MDTINWIEPVLYKRIKDVMPILCVDALIHIEDKFLLAKRSNGPAKGLWWTIGGRLYKGETIDNALIRKIKEETNMDVLVEGCIGIYDHIWEESNVHTPDIVYLVKPKHNAIDIKLDNQHSEYKWFSDTNGLHIYIKRILMDSKIGG